jgi:hypothetical protein
MFNTFDMAREMARLIDGGKSPRGGIPEMRRMFPAATLEDVERALRMQAEAARNFGSAEPDKSSSGICRTT